MTHSPPPGTPRARIPGPQQPPPPYPRIGPGLWRRFLGGGLALWALTAGTVYATRASAPLPTLILLGALLGPVAFVLWAYERHARDLGVSAVLGCFLAGATLDVPGIALVRPYPPHPSPGLLLGTALVEEAAKLAVLAFALRRLPGIRGTRAGLVLGAAVGLGFAAPASFGYAVDAIVSAGSTGSTDLRALLETELPRGVLTPLGHGLWTAVTGAALLSSRRVDGRFRLGPPVLAACMGACLLHVLTDSTPGLALWLAGRLTGAGVTPEHPAGAAGPAGRHLFALFSVGGLALVGLAGVGWVRSLARRGTPWSHTP
ncbi:PrsW family intramembrane metalloprotease [Streptomyces sp. LP11]|uniref:PrsW family intramembrane metalloprotease n=1 Tax=Streptomyces pyxinicus TaxID=2970331 RepID=A0ABT2B914_9ACTN|nr:PrsW family intramembrane metalloprotease [Streptomyces sp. LP11]MCS0605005.1 PrsW family intramembrane metalloprotease [Streptomyces sp. LP11]